MSKWLIALVCALSVTLGVAALLPARLVWAWVGDGVRAAAPALELRALAGTVWHGSARVAAPPQPPVDWQWRLSPWALLIGRLAADFEGAGPGLSLAGSAWAGITRKAAVTLPSAQIHADFINAQTLQYGLRLSGAFDIEDFHALLARHEREGAASPFWPRELAGKLSWPGGRIELQTPAGLVTPALPPLTGMASMQGDAIRLRMSSQGQPALDITLRPDGWAVMEVRQLLMQMLALPLPPSLPRGAKGQAQEDVIYIYEEKIL